MQVQKMKCRFLTYASVTLTVLVCASLAAWHWNKVFSFVYRCPVLGIIVTYIFPPEDYYVPLVSMPLQSGTMSSPCLCKYAGRYEVNVIGFGGFDWESYEMRMKVTIIDENNQACYFHEQSRSRTLVGYTKTGEKYLRLCYGVVDCPKDIPLNRALTVKVEGLDGVPEFVRKNSRAKIIFRKDFN